jgi:hypothetical protein
MVADFNGVYSRIAVSDSSDRYAVARNLDVAIGSSNLLDDNYQLAAQVARSI